MSEFKVPLTKIVHVYPHPNADRLEIAQVYGFDVVVQRGRYIVGDTALYIPVDSILPAYMESKLFPEDSKIKLSKSRIKQIRIRGFPSQGMLVSPDDFGIASKSMEQDFKEILGVTKYEPPEVEVPEGMRIVGGATGKMKNKANPLFHKYGGLDNVKWFPNKFAPDEEVVMQEKLHGTNARCGYLLRQLNWWQKPLAWMGILDKYEFVYGSNNVDISARRGNYQGFYGQDVYGKVFDRMEIHKWCPKDTILYGEIIGPGIQKGYDYGLTEHAFVLFDVKVNGEFLSPAESFRFAAHNGLAFVPVITSGAFHSCYEMAMTCFNSPSLFHEGTKVIEGVVFKASTDYFCSFLVIVTGKQIKDAREGKYE